MLTVILRRLLTRGVRKGARGSSGWAATGAAAAALMAMRRLGSRPTGTVYETSLKPGHSVTITAVEVPSRRDKKRARKAAKRAAKKSAAA
ncbi:MAG: hypothetical protein KDB86_02660 [Actinobacteria bacterium]|nr:hypothetical protein [Actinomycetota bacterium]MCB9388759.1 hypothetical protein [Acidimicrobiia bacterium]